MVTNFIKSIIPSSRTDKDPLRVTMCDDTKCPYHPIPIGEIKLTSYMRYKFNKTRRTPAVVETPKYNKKLGVIVSYRNRVEHLKKFPDHLKNFLSKQGINNEILIVEQHDDKPFNKGRLFNIGAQLMFDNCDYFCFHDIDMFPENSSYAYINHPVLLANSVSQFDNSPSQPTEFWHYHSSYFGGVILFRKKDYIKINGFSNSYWHWGCEDDDLLIRCLLCGLTPIAYTEGRYISLPHQKSITQTPDGIYHHDQKTITKLDKFYQNNKQRYKKMRRGIIDISQDGINSLNYVLVKKEVNELYTKISIFL